MNRCAVPPRCKPLVLAVICSYYANSLNNNGNTTCSSLGGCSYAIASAQTCDNSDGSGVSMNLGYFRHLDVQQYTAINLWLFGNFLK